MADKKPPPPKRERVLPRSPIVLQAERIAARVGLDVDEVADLLRKGRTPGQILELIHADD